MRHSIGFGPDGLLTCCATQRRWACASWPVAFCFALLAFGAGCVQSACPAGMIEVDGSCVPLESDLHPAQADFDAATGQSDQNAESDAWDGADAGGFDAGTIAVADLPETDELCTPGPCGEHGRCYVSNAGVAECICNQGYQQDAPDEPCQRNNCVTLTGETPYCHPLATCDYPGDGLEPTCVCPGPAGAYDGDGRFLGTGCARNACVPLDGDPEPCAPEEVCIPSLLPGARMCRCDEARGYHRCAQVEGCVDTQTDPEHCGECGRACAEGLACHEGDCEPRVVDMSLGTNNTCAVGPAGQLWCWGSQSLLHGFESPSDTPLRMPLDDVAQAAVGSGHACVRHTTTHEVTCWGNEADHRLGSINDGLGIQTFAPTALALHDISSSIEHTCIAGRAPNVDADRTWCWGSRRYGGLGDGQTEGDRGYDPDIAIGFPNSPYPHNRSGSVRSGIFLNCIAHNIAGWVSCWGLNNPMEAHFPRHIVYHVDRTVRLEARSEPGQLCVGSAHGCAVRHDGRVACWSHSNDMGQLGSLPEPAPARDEYVIVEALGHAQVTQIACGAAHTCAQTQNGQVYCWGSNDSGQLGVQDVEWRAEPEPVPGLAEVTHLFGGSLAQHTCAQTRDGHVYCWGNNQYGQLGGGRTGGDDGATFLHEPQEVVLWP